MQSVALPLCLINIYSLSILGALTVNPRKYSSYKSTYYLSLVESLKNGKDYKGLVNNSLNNSKIVARENLQNRAFVGYIPSYQLVGNLPIQEVDNIQN